METRVRRLLPGLFAVAAIAVVHAAVDVKTNYDRKTDFKAMRSYAWLETPPYRTEIAPDVRDPWLTKESLDAPIRAAVDRALTAKKFTPGGESASDFFVVYYAAFGAGMNESVIGEHYAYVTGWGTPLLGATPTQSLKVYEQGTLIVDVLQRDRKAAIWRVTATGALDRRKSTDERMKNLESAVKKMFAKFPPKP
jgi:hypothetical protein